MEGGSLDEKPECYICACTLKPDELLWGICEECDKVVDKILKTGRKSLEIPKKFEVGNE